MAWPTKQIVSLSHCHKHFHKLNSDIVRTPDIAHFCSHGKKRCTQTWVLVKQPLLKFCNLFSSHTTYFSHATPPKILQPLLKSHNLFSSHGTFLSHATSPYVTYPLLSFSNAININLNLNIIININTNITSHTC